MAGASLSGRPPSVEAPSQAERRSPSFLVACFPAGTRADGRAVLETRRRRGAVTVYG